MEEVFWFGRGSLRVFLALFACLALGAAAFAGSASANAVQPYGTNDAGGFRNVLPPGENGLDNLPQVLEYKSSKSIPKHFDDQQPLYENLLYGAPTLTDETVPNYFKDATFGVAPGEVESTIEPKPGVTISATRPTGSRTSTAKRAPTRCSARATRAPTTASS